MNNKRGITKRKQCHRFFKRNMPFGFEANYELRTNNVFHSRLRCKQTNVSSPHLQKAYLENRNSNFHTKQYFSHWWAILTNLYSSWFRPRFPNNTFSNVALYLKISLKGKQIVFCFHIENSRKCRESWETFRTLSEKSFVPRTI